MDEIAFERCLRKREMREACRIFAKHIRQERGFRFVGGIVGLLIVLTPCVALSMLPWPDSREPLLRIAGRGAILAVALGVFVQLRQWMRVNQFAMWYAIIAPPERVQAMADAHGITIRSEGFVCIQSWHQFSEIWITPRLVVCCNLIKPCAIPLADLGEERTSRLLNWISEAVPNRIKRR